VLENVTVEGRYRVVVTFLEPIVEATDLPANDRFWDSFGAWQDERTAEETISTC
jgi:hypothetical protein